MNCLCTCGYVPLSTTLTHVLQTPRGTSCSTLHATVQDIHPMHLCKSTTITYRFFPGTPIDRGCCKPYEDSFTFSDIQCLPFKSWGDLGTDLKSVPLIRVSNPETKLCGIRLSTLLKDHLYLISSLFFKCRKDAVILYTYILIDNRFYFLICQHLFCR